MTAVPSHVDLPNMTTGVIFTLFYMSVTKYLAFWKLLAKKTECFDGCNRNDNQVQRQKQTFRVELICDQI